MTINEEIVTLANQLANEGNKPTVALIKTKLNKKVPLPVIISTLRTWQHEPSFTSLPEKKSDNSKTTNTPTNAASIGQELHDELANMKKEILELKQLVKQLINKQKN
ncbi:MAG: hypothetical protein COB83_12400 [Gammaproteobacteria bacterium]|nr:MAG: hypothetical protein COB83_12400 [Gammaproteobacteria bacterium]